MGKYILIKNNKVENIIIAEPDYIELVKNNYDLIMDFDEHYQNPNPTDDVHIDDSGNVIFSTVVPEEIVDYIDAEEVEPTLSIDAPVTE